MAVVSNVEIRVDARNAIKQLDLIQGKSSKLPGDFKKGAVASKQLAGGMATAGTAARGLGAAIQSALAPLLAVTTAVAAAGKALNTAFRRDAAENRLRILTDSAGEYKAALALASQASQRFGLTQTQAAESLSDVYGRLKGLGFGLKETNEIFSGFNVIAKQAGISAEDASGAFIQLGQGLGSGALQGDELRSILERMPQLAQKLAVSMGEPVSRIRQLGSEGKITSEVMYKALAEAAQGADALGNALTPQQQAMNSFGQAAENAFNAFGEMLQPVVVPAIEAATWATTKLSEWWEYLSAKVFPQVAEAVKPVTDALQEAFGKLDLDYIVSVVQGALLKAINGILFVVKNVSKVLGFIVGKFKDLVDSPIMQTLLGALGAVVNKLGLANNEVGQFKEEQKKATAEAAATANQYSSLPAKVANVKEEQKKINEVLKQQTALLEQAARGQTKALTDNLSLAQARYGTERQLLSNQIQQAQVAGNSSKVYRLKVKLAELDYDIAVQRIKAEVRKLEIAKQLAKAKVKELEVAVLQTAEGSKEEARLKRAVALQLEAVKQATANLSRGKELAKEQIKGAAAVKAGAIAAAKAERSAAANAKSTRAAAEASGQYADNMQRGANAAGRAASSLSRLTGGLGQASKTYTVSGAIGIQGASKEAIAQAGGLEQFNDFMMRNKGYISYLREWNRFANKVIAADQQLSASGATRTPAFASGGYVSSPTNAMIGEGGSEYVIPASKMSAAMERYAAGKRGDAVVPNGNDTQVNVSTGPVMQMNGQNYVTQSDFEKGLRSTVNQVMTTLRRSPNTRAAVGI